MTPSASSLAEAARIEELPEARRELLPRPRLLDVMAARFDRPVTVLTAGAGFGKSTLLLQSVHDLIAAAKGIDTFHRIEPYDADPATLLSTLTERLTGVAPTSPSVQLLVDAMWHESPAHVTLMLDDIHLLPDDAGSWAMLDELIAALPKSAHLVISGRGRLNLKLSRLLANGDAIEITEDAMAFTSTELDAFARLRHVERTQLADHGWPALAELEAHSGRAGAHNYVAEEVLDQLAPARVATLRLAAVHNVIDDGIVAAVTPSGPTQSAAELVDGLPLTTQRADGSYALHDLWRDVLVSTLSDEQRSAALSAVARELLGRGALRSACEVAIEAGDHDVAREVLTEFTRDIQLAHPVADRDAIAMTIPPELAGTPEVLLLRADAVFATEPNRAGAELRKAIDVALRDGPAEVAVLALIRLGDLAYRSGDVSGLADAHNTLATLHADRATGAEAALMLLEVWQLMLDNGAAKALALMGSPAFHSYEPVASLVGYYRAVQHGFAGQCDASLAAIEDLRRTPQGRILDRMGGFASIMKWYLGDLTAEDRDNTMRLLETIGRDRQVHLYVEGAAMAAILMASAGDVDGATAALAEAHAHRDRVPDTAWGSIIVELATAVLELLDGDEDAAAARLDAAVPASGPFSGFSRHVFGSVGALLYVLVPRVRPYFDDEEIGPDLAVGTTVGRALVELREHGLVEPAARLPWDKLSRLRTWAYEPHLAELALAAVAGGTLRAGDAIDSLLNNPRAVLRSIAARHTGAVGDLATARLAATPERPNAPLRINVLGGLEVWQGELSLQDSAPMRRKMVRELLMMLVHRRRIKRAEAIDLLWPDKDEAAGNNNLRATLMHVRTLVEPGDLAEDAADAPPWHLRSDGEYLSLFDSDLLQVDSDEFSRQIDIARAADRDRRPGATLEHFGRAIELYRGEYVTDASDPDWAYHHRMRLHLDFVEASVRCSELLTAQGDAGDAALHASRAVEAESLSEPAHRALVRALLVSGDRAGARRAHARVLEILTADWLEPEAATVRLGAEL